MEQTSYGSPAEVLEEIENDRKKYGGRIRKLKKETFMKLEKYRVGQLVCFLFLEVFVLGLYFIGGRWVEEQGKKERLSTQNVVVDYNTLVQIEDVSMQENAIVFSGWALRLYSRKTDLDIILKEVNGTKSLVFDTEGVVRKDIEEEFESTWDYSESGFEAKIPSRKIDNDICYEVQLGISYIEDGNKEISIKVSTSRYLYDGEIYKCNPLTFEEPKTNDEEVVKVINQGDLCSYSSEKNVWIYMYLGKMYWILDEKYVPELEKKPSIPWSLYTHRGDLAPKDKVKTGEETYVHYSIYLKESDLIEGVGTKYYVVSKELPTEYPVTYVRTGVWTSTELWRYRTNFQIFEANRN